MKPKMNFLSAYRLIWPFSFSKHYYDSCLNHIDVLVTISLKYFEMDAFTLVDLTGYLETFKYFSNILNMSGHKFTLNLVNLIVL